MNRKNTARLATVTEIHTIPDIQDPKKENENFVIAIVDDGWQVVVEKEKFNVGDQGTFIPSGSWIPNTLIPFSQVGEYKSIKGAYLPVLKRFGAISEGILIEADKYNDNLEVRVWERDLPEEFECKKYRTYPTFLKTLEYPHAQEIPEEIFKTHYHENFEVTPRLDGIEMIVYVKNGRFGICNEKYDIPEQSNNAFWKLAYDLNLINPMIDYRDQYAIHGTILGKGVYNNLERIPERRFFIHDIYDIEKSAFVSSKKRYKIFSDLCEFCSFDHVKVFDKSISLAHVATNMRDLVSYANGTSIEPFSKRRGLIFKSNDSDFSFKVKSNNFCIANKI